MDDNTVDHIVFLKRRLLEERSPGLLKRKLDVYAEGVEINTPINRASTGSMSNRGNKLYNNESLRLSNLKSFPSSMQMDLMDEENQKLVLNDEYYLSNKRPRTQGDDDDDEDSEEDSDDPVASIDLTDILAPIQHPSDIITRKTYNRIFNLEKKGNHLLKIAYDTIEMIESEQETVIQLTKLMNMFLGDGYQELTPDNINLPDYDHKLSLNDLNLSLINDPAELFQELEENADDTREEDDKAHTRSKDNARITDPFFQLPNFTQNKSIESIDPQELEETRQLTQITLQRNQEFIRCLTKIRNGCVKVDKFKQNIYKWAKEMSGDYSESSNQIVQKEPSTDSS